MWFFFFFQAEDGIRDYKVTGVQTCALPIFAARASRRACAVRPQRPAIKTKSRGFGASQAEAEIGRASCRGRGEISGVAVSLKKKKEKQEEALMQQQAQSH